MLGWVFLPGSVSLADESAEGLTMGQIKASQTALQNQSFWYKDAIIYELHIRAFKDSDGDGMGDFRGLTEKLDYLQDLLGLGSEARLNRPSTATGNWRWRCTQEELTLDLQERLKRMTVMYGR